MAKLTAQQKRALARVAKIQVGDEKLLEKLIEAADQFDFDNQREKALGLLESIDKAIRQGMVKGDKGDPGEKGDMPSTSEVRAYLQEIFENNYQSLKPEDGKTPEKGVDYFTPEEKADIIADILSLIELDDINAASVARQMEELPENDKLSFNALKDVPDFAEMEFDAKKIKNLEDLLPKRPPIFGGGSGATFFKSLRDVELSKPLRNDMIVQWQTDKQKFATTFALTVSDTAPSNPVEGDIWIDVS